jgi:hypothetical protein
LINNYSDLSELSVSVVNTVFTVNPEEPRKNNALSKDIAPPIGFYPFF